MSRTKDHADSATAAAPLLSARDAYLAMYYFVREYWERGGRRDGNVTLLCNDLGPLEDPSDPGRVKTTDPAFWDDWLAAVKRARTEGFPAKL
jgi:hypothetical protein